MKRPKFWNQFSEIIGVVLSLLSCCIGAINFPDKWNFWQTSIAIVGIFFLTYLTCLLLYNVIYSLMLFKYCEKIEKKYDTLLKQKEKIANNNNKYVLAIKEMQELLRQYKFNQNSLINEINAGTLPITKYEKKYLENLLKSAYKKKEHINNMEGKK